MRQPSHERQKTHAGHYLSLTETAKRAIKVSRFQGMPRQALTFFLRATAFFNSQCDNIWLIDKLKRCFPSGLELLCPYYFQPCSRGSRLFQLRRKEKSLQGALPGDGLYPRRACLQARRIVACARLSDSKVGTY